MLRRLRLFWCLVRTCPVNIGYLFLRRREKVWVAFHISVRIASRQTCSAVSSPPMWLQTSRLPTHAVWGEYLAVELNRWAEFSCMRWWEGESIYHLSCIPTLIPQSPSPSSYPELKTQTLLPKNNHCLQDASRTFPPPSDLLGISRRCRWCLHHSSHRQDLRRNSQAARVFDKPISQSSAEGILQLIGLRV